jgi:hypothetical protein
MSFSIQWVLSPALSVVSVRGRPNCFLFTRLMLAASTGAHFREEAHNNPMFRTARNLCRHILAPGSRYSSRRTFAIHLAFNAFKCVRPTFGSCVASATFVEEVPRKPCYNTNSLFSWYQLVPS